MVTSLFFFFFAIHLDYAFQFKNKGVKDYVYLKLSRMPSLTSFTVCMWLILRNSQGAPFSYAVSSEDNELLIFYNKHFQLTIGGDNRYRKD